MNRMLKSQDRDSWISIIGGDICTERYYLSFEKTWVDSLTLLGTRVCRRVNETTRTRCAPRPRGGWSGCRGPGPPASALAPLSPLETSWAWPSYSGTRSWSGSPGDPAPLRADTASPPSSTWRSQILVSIWRRGEIVNSCDCWGESATCSVGR